MLDVSKSKKFNKPSGAVEIYFLKQELYLHDFVPKVLNQLKLYHFRRVHLNIRFMRFGG